MSGTASQMIDPVYTIVFTTALLGSGHCITMCGPLVTALCLADCRRKQSILFHLFYNVGRVTTYVCIGVAAGWIGSLLHTAGAFTLVSQAVLVAADLFVIAIGLTAGGLLKQPAFLRLEAPGEFSALGRTIVRFRKLPTALSSFPIGLIMGLLPCGFLYAIVLAAAGRGSVVEGGLIMLAFGLGTLPSLFFFGSAVHWLSGRLRTELLRWAGLMVVFIGCYNLYQHIQAWFLS